MSSTGSRLIVVDLVARKQMKQIYLNYIGKITLYTQRRTSDKNTEKLNAL